MKRKSVLLDWVETLSWKQQSTLLSSLRGPDDKNSPNIKKLSKWLRKITQTNADPSSPYMINQNNLPMIENIKSEIEMHSGHYINHLLQGLEIVGYFHPDKGISEKAKEIYERLVMNLFHLNPETKEQLEQRLRNLN